MARSSHVSASVTTGSNIEGLSGLLTAVLAQTTNIQAADSAVDSKANNLMAASLVIVALLGTQLFDAGHHLRSFAIAAMGVLILVVVTVLYATRNREYEGAVVQLDKHPEYFLKDNELLLAQLIEDARKANVCNNTILEDKRTFFRLAILVFMVGFGLGVAALFINAPWGSIL
jgi:hypothetical protein